jgi:hypothetical protein
MAQYRHDSARVHSGIPEPRCSRVSQIMKVKIFKSCFSTRRTKTSHSDQERHENREDRNQVHKQNHQEFMAQFLGRNIEFKKTGRTYVEPSDIMALQDGDSEWNEGHPDFWSHHGNPPEFYDSMAREYPSLRERLARGESAEELKHDPESKTAFEFWWASQIKSKLQNSKGSYFVDEAGFHRVALAKKNGLGEIPCLVTEASLKSPQE